jgi:isopentenyldiphosphate isomerase
MDPARLAQDPDELFDVVSADGLPLGRAKPRAAIHRDGDWHRAIHVWVYGQRESGPFLLFQRRGRHKDTAAGRLDPTVGGHFGAGETRDEVWREVEEEIGVQAEPAAMRFAGVRVRSSEAEPGIIDRELQEVWLWRRDDPLDAYAPNPAELEGLVEVPVAPLVRLFAESDRAAILARLLDATTRTERAVGLAPEEFLPSVDRYPYRVAVAVLAALREDEWIAV